MKVFYAEFHGMWLGGHAVVTADNEAEARAMVERAMVAAHIADKRDTIKIHEVGIAERGITAFDNGDY